MQILNITPAPLLVKPRYLQPEKDNPMPHVVGWWSVSTEGDVEGRSTRQLGEYYGHVAEIAFHLADKAMYELRFKPIHPFVTAVRPHYNATRNYVWVSLGPEDGPFYQLEDQTRAKAFAQWLDTPQVRVSHKGIHNEAYYKASHLMLV